MDTRTRTTTPNRGTQTATGYRLQAVLLVIVAIGLLASASSWSGDWPEPSKSVNSSTKAEGGPPVLPDIDPLKQPPPVLKTAVSFESDLRPAAAKIVPTLHEATAQAQDGAVIDIIVTLQEPSLDTESTPGTKEHEEFRAQHIASLEHAFAAEASFHGFDTKRGLKHTPAVSGSISVDSIEALASLPMVRAIEFDHRDQLTRIEGGNLIHAFQLQNQGGQGDGIGVAVVDSGINWTHPELLDQVTARFDFTGTQTSNPGFDDQGHGTKCAGIIAGNQDGMAPQSHLWAMKACTPDGCAQSSIEAALDAIYDYRNDYGGVHVVNMSLGGGAPINYICDADYPSYTAVLGQLVGAGIAVFASSGNEGCTNGISRPACISHTISVGAVYDANVGSPYYDPKVCMPLGCLDISTDADMIACYSNSGTYLDLLAPSHCANTTDLGGGYDECFGGTSAAAPYASGVAAQILSLLPDTTPAELRQALKSTGEPITDPKNGLTRNRIDAVEAYQYLTGSGCTYSITPEEADFDLGGGVGTIEVNTQTGCNWSTQNALSWVHITSGQSGVGPGTVGYRVDSNPGDEPRTGTMTVAGQVFTVNQSGDCTAEYPPDPAFAVTPNPATAGQYVQFTHTGNAPGFKAQPFDGSTTSEPQSTGDGEATAGVDQPKALLLPIGLTASPMSPQIGEEVTFEITGYGGDVEAHWNFGGSGCAPYTQTFVCEPTFTNCLDSSYKFASAGAKTVTVTAYQPGTTTVIGSAMVTVTVQATGTCGGCTYTLSPTSRDFPAAGGTGSFNVATNAGCGWTADPSASWITITSGASGSGPGTVNYSVGVNSGTARQGNIDVENRLHTITQAGGGGGGTDPATEWSWTVRLGGQVVVTSSEPSFTHRFTTAGLYTVELEAANCFDSATATQILEVLPAPPVEDFLVPAAAHTAGLNGTVWMTDLRIFNPCLDTVDVTIEYLPEATDNSNTVVHGLEFELPADATQIFDDIVQQIPGIPGDDNKGSLHFIFDGGNGCTPLIVSRTYNDTPEGTFGQYVPAVPVVPLDQERVFLTGMVDNFYYRTNVGLANFGPDNVGNIGITVYDEFGQQLGDTITTWVPGYSTRQIVEVIERAGILTDVNIFSVAIDTNGADLTMYASVVDNFTGDPVYYVPAGTDEVKVWIPGIAHLAGANQSQWRSDITFLNETGDAISARVDYVPEVDLGYSPFMIMNIDPGNALYYVDILGVSMLPPNTESKGYFVVTSRGDYGVPHMVARTYNLAPDGGTFGQNLKVFGEGDLIHEGEFGYVPGVGSSSSPDTGFRTNVGILNTDTDSGANVLLRAYYQNGALHGVIPHLWLPPRAFTQESLTSLFALQGTEAVLSIEVEVESGGPVAAYASEIDNRTQDPILIPAIRGQSPGR